MLFNSNIYATHTKRKTMTIAILEACTAHNAEHCIALRYCRYAFWQVAVGSHIFRYQPSCQRNQRVCIDIVE